MTLVELGKYLVSKGLAETFLAAPGQPTVTPQGTAGATTYTYVIVGTNQLGATVGSVPGTTATGNAALSGADFNRLTWAALAGATGYDIYRTVGGATQGKIGSAVVVTFDDTGLVGDGSAAPVTNTAATDIHLGVLGENPDAAIGLIASASRRTSDTQFGTTALRFEFPTIQVLTRGAAYDIGASEVRAHSAYREIAKIQNDELSGVLWVNAPVTAPYQLTPDKKHRPIWSFYVTPQKALSTS